jgi:hypothetical protein
MVPLVSTILRAVKKEGPLESETHFQPHILQPAPEIESWEPISMVLSFFLQDIACTKKKI